MSEAEQVMTDDDDHTNPGYVLGAVLAQLEDLDHDARVGVLREALALALEEANAAGKAEINDDDDDTENDVCPGCGAQYAIAAGHACKIKIAGHDAREALYRAWARDMVPTIERINAKLAGRAVWVLQIHVGDTHAFTSAGQADSVRTIMTSCPGGPRLAVAAKTGELLISDTNPEIVVRYLEGAAAALSYGGG